MSETVNPNETAMRNLKALRSNPYPGRGFIIGMTVDGSHAVQVYWIMGRSENSRNRIFSASEGRVYTEAADPSKMTDPSLIIYDAMAEREKTFVVSNGAQTSEVADGVVEGKSLPGILYSWSHEQDPPNNTPRITGMYSLSNSNHTTPLQISILKKSPFGDYTDRFHYRYSRPEPAYGYCITTYMSDGNPLPSFCGEPLLVPVTNSMENMASVYWDSLNKENRVAIAVKFINLSTWKSEVRIINRFKKL